VSLEKDLLVQQRRELPLVLWDPKLRGWRPASEPLDLLPGSVLLLQVPLSSGRLRLATVLELALWLSGNISALRNEQLVRLSSSDIPG
jgi:hypothetical protein